VRYNGSHRTMHPFRSIRARILVGFLLVLALSAAVSVTVWRVSGQLKEALEAEAASQRSAQDSGAVRTTLLNVRLGTADYLRSGGTAERDALEVAMTSLERAAKLVEEANSVSVAQGRGALVRQIRAELLSVSDAIEQRRAAAGRLARISHTHRRSMVNCKFAWLAKALRVTDCHRQGWPKNRLFLRRSPQMMRSALIYLQDFGLRHPISQDV